ncbi:MULTISPECIES: FHA domain-containing protein [unclassified Corallococcus]|uniref:FHA domain-containing protein n=1 Tax=unclassified Corallococcus TaxID=2685029 RepID=UPI001A8F104D|nr:MULTISPECIES: FHA domain-containing protein [unclassified Corallococcus]MBN9683786.1 FHA domain-containing protein [Corallococcus sp. NCSPR001]WAS84713.1 FHA domain-containing protein [Corallococcus sp. NCRR]
MSVRLTVTQRSEAGGASGKEVVLDDSVITLGRDKTCQVVLPQQAVSRNHARISQEGTLYFLEDLGSAYGTKINGKSLPKGEKELLRNGDVIAIAQYDVRFDKVVEIAPDVSDKTSFLARGILKDAMRGLAGGEERFLRYMNGPREGQRIEISEAQEHIFGRDEKEADVILKDDLVSRKHAKVRRDWSGTHVEDLGSRNGIKVNKKRVNRKALKDGDELEIGATRFVYVDPAEPPDEPAVSLSSENSAVVPAPSPPRPSPPKREEPPPPEPEPEPQPEPEPSPPEEQPSSEDGSASSSEEPQPDGGEDMPMPEPEPEPAPAAVSALADKKKLVPLIVMGVVGLSFLVLMIAVLAGA